MRNGPSVLGYADGDPDTPSDLDSAPDVPRSLVVDGAFSWDDGAPLRRPYANTIVYETHVKGFHHAASGCVGRAARDLRGLGHEAAVCYLTGLGVIAVELLPVHELVPEGMLTDRGLINYWGYNTIGVFAPTQRYSAAVRAGHPGGQVAEFKAMVAALHAAEHR